MRLQLWLSAVVLVVLVATPAWAQLKATVVVSGLAEPVAVVQDPADATVQFVVEQGGRIRIVQNGTLLAQNFLDISNAITSGGERGLLGLAFAPDYATSGRFFVDFTDLSGNTVIARFTRSAGNPLIADPSSRFDLIWPDGNAFIFQPFANHNGGQVAFGPDNFLYIGMGDGGSADDPLNNAQNLSSLLGKILRIDVSVSDSDMRGYRVPANNPFVGRPGALGEIWDLGVRNPWRFSFDSVTLGGTGALVIGDVGQDAWEEVDYEPAGLGGRNYGWRNREGAHDNVTTIPPVILPLVDPILEYSHAVGHSITGGVVYRGTALGASFNGRYFFGDFVNGRVWSAALTIDPMTGQATAGAMTEHTADLGPAAGQPSAFGVDASGELLILNYGGGALYRVEPQFVCDTPDPFVALGGGTCFNGGWLPPGMPFPGTTSTPPPPPSSTPTTCTTPDPFTALGGGTCFNGGWLPPGMPVPGGTSTPPPTPPPSPTTCTTPDPFVVLGGGTCFNGGWLPPGMPIPGGGGQ